MAQGITITYNGLTLGDGSNYYISLLDAGQLPNRQADQLASGRDGGFIFNQSYGMREIAIDVNIFSPTDAQLFTDIKNLRKAFAKTNTAKELVINYWDGNIRKIDVFPATFPNPQHRPGDTNKSSFSLILTAPYPFYKGSGSDVINTTLYLDNSLGFDYPVTYPFNYVVGTSVSSYSFNNDGDVPALVEIVFNGTAISPTLTNTSIGKFVQIDTTLTSGTSITLKYTSTGRSITDQLGSSYEIFFNGETAFFFIPIGVNTFVYTASTYDAVASCNLKLTKYFLS